MRNTRITVLAEVALAIAMSAVLNYIGLHFMPQGGSISLVMLPIMIVALRRGVAAGIVAGALYGGVDYLMNPYVVHWVQPILDYPLAYAGVGLTGLFANAWNTAVSERSTARAIWTTVLPAVLLGTSVRFLAHVVSGVIFFAEYAPEGQPVLIYSVLYNLTYMLPSAIACAVGAMLLMPALRNVGSTAATARTAQ